MAESKKNDKVIRLGYFSGTRSHNKDFAVITDVLISVLNQFKNVRLFLAGPLNIEERLKKYQDQIETSNYVARDKHFENISKVDINLVPLEAGNPFCEAKSELKFFEAGILQVPSITSGTQSFKEVIQDGKNGFIASSLDEWKEKLFRLISSEQLRNQIGCRARDKVLQEYITSNSNKTEFYNHLKEKI